MPWAKAPHQRWALQKERAAARVAGSPNVSVRYFENAVHDVPLHWPRELAQAIGDFAATLSDSA